MIESLDEHLSAGRIRRSSSHSASGTLMVPKDNPDAIPQVVHDYCTLNTRTIEDHTPVTRQDNIIESLASATVRGKIDLICAYYQILMAKGDINQTAFEMAFGVYEWLVMP